MLLEEVPVRLLVEQRRTERLDLTAVIAPTNAEYHAAFCEDIGRREVLREPERMPHRRDVKPAAEHEVLRKAGEVLCEHEDVWYALVALGLKVVLCHPKGIKAGAVHDFGNRLRLIVGGDQVLVGKTTVVDGSAPIAHVVHVHVAREQAVKLRNHIFTSKTG